MRGPQLADLVEEDRPAIGLLEVPLTFSDGAGEAALRVTEQLALEQLRRDRGHVDGDERPAGARAQAVDRAREQLLARPGLAGDEDRQGRARRLLEIPEQRQHHRIAGDDPDLRALAPEPLLLGVVERHRAAVGRPQLALEVTQEASRLLLVQPRLRELLPQRVRGLEQLALGAGGARRRGARRLEVFLERLDRRLLAYQRLAHPFHLALEAAQAAGGAELAPREGAGAPDDERPRRKQQRQDQAEE